MKTARDDLPDYKIHSYIYTISRAEPASLAWVADVRLAAWTSELEYIYIYIYVQIYDRSRSVNVVLVASSQLALRLSLSFPPPPFLSLPKPSIL